MNKPLKIISVLILLIVSTIVFSFFYLPVNRVGISSELIMLGDLNNDNRWDAKDKNYLRVRAKINSHFSLEKWSSSSLAVACSASG